MYYLKILGFFFYCNIIIWRINASCVFSRLYLWLTNNILQSECSAVCGTIHLLKDIWIPKVLTSRTKSSVNNSSVEFMNLGLHFSEINAPDCKCWVIECLYIVVNFNKLMTNCFFRLENNVIKWDIGHTFYQQGLNNPVSLHPCHFLHSHR